MGGAIGSLAGAAIGSIVPGVGTALGASLGGAAGGLFGSKGGGGGTRPATSGVYQPQDTANQDSNLIALLNQNGGFLHGEQNPYTQLKPQIDQTFAQLFNTPGMAGFNTAAGNAGNAYTNVGNRSISGSGALDSAALSNLPGASAVYNMGIDPQNALYNRELQKTRDLANVTNAQYGLTGQQAGSSVNDALSNFNIDWQDRELGRALQGLSGATNAVSGVGNQLTQGQNVGSAGAGSILSGGATPYTTGQSIGSDQESAITQYISQLLGPVNSSESTIHDLMQYLGLGVNASSAGASQGLANYNSQVSGAQGGAMGGSSLGSALSGLFNTQATPVSSGGGGGGSLPWLASNFDNEAYANGLPWSDRELKENIRFIRRENGHKVYSFTYIGNPKRYEGVMAQEVLEKRPDAVGERAGFLTVDYGKIGVRFRDAH